MMEKIFIPSTNNDLYDHIINDECIVPAASIIMATLNDSMTNFIFKRKMKIEDQLVWCQESNDKVIGKFFNRNEEICSYNIDNKNDEIKKIDYSGWNFSKIFSRADIYKFFDHQNYNYGDNFKVIENIYFNDKKNYAKIEFKKKNIVNIIDGTFQAIVFLQNNLKRCIPIFIKNIIKYSTPCNDNDFVSYVTKNGDFQIVNKTTNDVVIYGNGIVFRADIDKKNGDMRIGISSYAFKLPGGVDNMDKLYDYLKEGKTSNVKKSRLNYPGNYLDEDISLFDAKFFDISKSEACKMDPQHRLLLEVSYECLEKNNLLDKKSNIGFFVGYMGSEYSDLMTSSDSLSLLGVTTSVVSGRLNYFFNSNGPSIVVDTACSSSLVALEMACSAIKNKSCDKALVAGVSLMISGKAMENRIQGKMISKDGRCYSFDQRANGYGRSEGVVAILIEALNHDCDVEILNIAVNHSGKSISLTTPSEFSQKELLKVILSKDSSIKVDYWEAHGTGTKLGDPIEIRALDTMLKGQKCFVGTIKANFGHTEAASGLMSVIKIILQMERNIIFKHPDLKQINSEIEVSNIKFVTSNIQQNVNICGVSSFGIAGTNAMALFKKNNKNKKISLNVNCGIILVSGASQNSLDQNISSMIDFVGLNNDNFDYIGLESIFRRKHYNNRAVILRNMKVFKKADEVKNYSTYCGNKFPIKLKDTVIRNEFDMSSFFKNLFPFAIKPSVDGMGYSLEYIELLLAKYYLFGETIDYSLVYGKDMLTCSKIHSLPPYKFDKQKYWIVETSDDNVKINSKEMSISEKMINILEDEVGRSVDETDSFAQLGLDSLALTNLMSLFLKIDGIDDLTLEDLFRFSTIKELIEEVEKRNGVVSATDKEEYKSNYLMYNILSSPETSLTTIDVDMYFVLINSSGTWQLIKKQNDIVFTNYGKKQDIKIGIDVTNVNNDSNDLKTLILCFNMLIKELIDMKKTYNYSDNVGIKIGFLYSSHKTVVGNALYSMLKSLISEYYPEICFISDDLASINLEGINIIKSSSNLIFHGNNDVWIISGGSKGIGLELINFIIKKSSKTVKIYSLSRRKAVYNTPNNNVIQCNGDVSDYNFILSVFKDIIDSGKRLKGIIHNAGTVCDASVRNQNFITFDKVWTPKVQGLFNFEKALKNCKLVPEYFICNSSISALIGNQGQTNYSSANAFLDGIMKEIREEMKICALSINWGNWLETGIAKANQLNDILKRKGMIGLTNDDALMCFEHVLRTKCNNVVIANICWEKVMKTRNDLKCLQIIDSNYEENKVDDEKYVSLESMFNFKEKIIEIISNHFPSLSKEDYEEKNFIELGVDSLFLHDLVEELKAQIPNVKLKVIDLFEYSTVKELSEHIKILYEEEINSNDPFSEIEKMYFENHYLNEYPICPGILQVYKLSEKLKQMKFKEIKFHNMLTLKHANNIILQIDGPNKIVMKNTIGDSGLIYVSAHPYNDIKEEMKVTDYHNTYEDIMVSSNEIASFYKTLDSYGFDYGPKLQLLYYTSIRLRKIGEAYIHATCIVNEYFSIADKDIQQKEWCLFELSLQVLAYLSYFFDRTFKQSKKKPSMEYILVPIYIDKIHFSNITNIKEKLLTNNLLSYSFILEVDITEFGNDTISGDAKIYLRNKDSKGGTNEDILFGFIEKVVAKKLNQNVNRRQFSRRHSESLKSKRSMLRRFQKYNSIDRDDASSNESKSSSLLFPDTTFEEEYTTLINSRKTALTTGSSEVDADLIKVESNKSLIKLIADRKISSISETFQDSPKSPFEGFFFGNSCLRKRSSSLNLTGYNEYKYIKQRGLTTFDNIYFKLSPIEATYMDPQQRILLELTAEALQNITLPSNETGVFIGSCTSDFQMKCFKELKESELSKYLSTGVNQNMLSGKISNFFNFTGPSLTVDTACSSFMTALSLACLHLKNKLCKYAIVGGINLIMNSEIENVLIKSKVISETGQCRPLDDDCDGFVRSQGAGVFILEADVASDYPELLSCSMNHNGNSLNVNVPVSSREEEVMQKAITEAKVKVSDIDVIEVHGSGTSIGDKIELNAINNIFKNIKKRVYITASKGRYGHCEGAAGLISMIEMLKAFENEKLQSIGNFKSLNKSILLNDNLLICDKDIPTRTNIALINCFGFSGSNCCAVIKNGNKKSPFVKRLPWIMEYLWPFNDKYLKDVQKICWSPFTLDNNDEVSYKKDSNDKKIYVETFNDIILSLKKWRTRRYNCMNFITTTKDNGLHGMLKSISKEKRLFRFRLFILEDKSLLEKINLNMYFVKNTENKTIFINKLGKAFTKEIVIDQINLNTFNTKVYKKIFITGGNGGIAREILNQFKYHEAILLSQGSLTRKLPPSQYYIQGNVDDLDLITSIFNLNPDIDCVIHTSGIIKNGMIDNLSSNDFDTVMVPKVKGLENLLKNIRECSDVKTMIILSSIASFYGSVGQSNYALANDAMSEKCLEYFKNENNKIQMLIFDLGPIKGTGMLYKDIEGMDKIRKQIENGDWEMLDVHNVVNDIKTYVDNDIFGRYALFKIKEKVTTNKGNHDCKATKSDVKKEIIKVIKDITGFNNFDESKGFMTLGFDSLMLETMREQIEKIFNITLNIEELFEYSNTTELIKYVESLVNEKCNNKMTSSKVAIISYSGTFSGSKNSDEYFFNLMNEKECFEKRTDFKTNKKKNFIPFGGVIPDHDIFNDNFMDLPYETVSKLDPQVKHFSNQIGKAIDLCGLEIANFKIGVIASAEPSATLKNGSKDLQGNLLNLFHLNQKDFIALWAAHLYNFTGPCFNVYSACSSSIVAIQQAINILLLREADIMIVGCVSLQSPSEIGHEFASGLMMSSEPHCRPFCNEATGIIRGSGCGVVILKLLEDALHDGDEIFGIINGISINNDGKNKSNFLAPNIKGQESVIKNAIGESDITKDDIDYVECHCTGTVLGDKIELQVLKKIFGDNKFYRITKGSVKANIGHCFAASGIASIIKVLEMMKHQQIPKQLHCENRLCSQYIKYALINSFGIGGTNGALILCNPKDKIKKKKKFKETYINHAPLIFPFSATTKHELIEKLDHFHGLIEMENLEINFLPIWKSIIEKNSNLPWRCCLIGSNFSMLMKCLKNKEYDFYYTEKDITSSNVAFYFAPQGVEYKYMGEELLIMEEFKDEVDNIIKKFSINIFDQCLMEDINSTSNAQIGLFLLSQCLINCLEKFGITSKYLFGHSLGEYSALVAGGWLKTKETLEVLKNRGKLMEKTDEAVMCAVKGNGFIEKLEELKVNKMINESDIEISAILSSNICCIVGSKDNIEKLKSFTIDNHFDFKNLRNKHGFHTSMINCILGEFEKVLDEQDFIKDDDCSKKLVISNVNGKIIGEDESLSTTYFLQHARFPVRLDLSIKKLIELNDINVIFEIGPQGILKNVLLNEKFLLLDSIQGRAANLKCKENILVKSIGRLWCEGYNGINFSGKCDLEAINDYFIDFTFSTFNFWRLNFEEVSTYDIATYDVIVLSEFDYEKIKTNKLEWAKMNNMNILFTIENLSRVTILMCALLSEIQCLNTTISVQICLKNNKGNNFIQNITNTFAYTTFQSNIPHILKYKKMKYLESFSYSPQSVVIFGANGCVGRIISNVVREIFPKASIFAGSTSYNVDVTIKSDVDNFLNSVISSGESIDYIIFCSGLPPAHVPEEEILDVKYQGIKNIAEYLIQRPLKAKKLILISSLSSMLGILNEGYYAASNLYFDILSLSTSMFEEKFSEAFENIFSIQLPPVLGETSMFSKGIDSDFHDLFKENGILEDELSEKFKIILKSNEKGVVCISKHNPEIIRQIVSQNQQLITINTSKDIFLENEAVINNLKEVWKDVLGSYPKSNKANFFESGGNSLSVLQLIWRLHDDFKIEKVYEDPSFYGILKEYEYLLSQKRSLLNSGNKICLKILETNWSQKNMMLLKEISFKGAYNIVFMITLFDGIKFRNKLIDIIHQMVKIQPGLRCQFMKESRSIEFLSLTDSFYYLKCSKYNSKDIEEELNIDFDYNDGSPIRFRLFRKKNNLELLINQQHITTDGWSMTIFGKYFETLWNNSCSIDNSLKDICLCQNDIISEEEMYRKIDSYILEYDYLKFSKESTRIIADKLNDKKVFKSLKVIVPSKLFKRIKTKCIEKGLTNFVVTLTAFVILVECWSDNFNEEHLVIGVPVSGRKNVHQQNVIGCFLNNILIIINKKKLKNCNGNIDKIIEYVNEQFMKAKNYEDIPFNELVLKINPQRDSNSHPFFEVFFNYRHSLDYPIVNLRDVTRTEVKQVSKNNIFDFSMTIDEVCDDLQITVDFNEGRYSLDHVKKIIKDYLIILNELCDGSFVKKSLNVKKYDIPNISIQEIITKQHFFNSSHYDYFQKCYQIENEYFSTTGEIISSDLLIGIDINDTSVHNIISIILTSACYVPIEKEIDEDIYVIRNNFQNDVIIDRDIKFRNKNKNEDLLYCIFTSGTTGKKKGVLINQKNVINFLISSTKSFFINENSILLDSIRYSFDISIFNIFITLTHGGKLLTNRDKGYHTHIENVNTNLTHILLSSAVFNSLSNGDIEKLSEMENLQYLIVGGETPDRNQIEKCRRRNIYVQEIYGPTETTIWVTEKRNPFIGESIGKQIDNVSVSLKNSNILRESSFYGEIVIRGTCIFRGYLNMGASNNEYWSGDLGFFDKSGDIIYSGRKNEDFIKVKGARVNINYVKHLLVDLYKNKNIVVIKHEDSLIAFIKSDIAIMKIDDVVDKIIAVTKFPLTLNGKIDKKKLISKLSRGEEANSNINSNLLLKKLWLDILPTNSITINSNFLLEGGNSLSLIRLRKSIEEEFNISISVHELYNKPNFYEMESIINEKIFGALTNPIKVLKEDPTSDHIIYIFFAVGGTLYPFYSLLHFFDCEVRGFEYDSEFQDYNLSMLAEYYASFISKDSSKKIYLMGHSLGGILAREVYIILEKNTTKKCQLQKSVVMLDSWAINNNELDLDIVKTYINDKFKILPHYEELTKKALILAKMLKEHTISNVSNSSKIILLKAEELGTSALKHTIKMEPLESYVRSCFDNGWLKYCKDLEIHLIDGDHDSILQLHNSKKWIHKIKHILPLK
uniref:Carrier domain-containing protein n=1 Tax=Parastrongyloides trichosuri TaxID=131310 RepID=A0A0N4Z5X4_PARTI